MKKQIILTALFLFGFTTLFAQQLEIRFNKDLAQPKEIMNSWGLGASINIDEAVEKIIFRINFDWSTYKLKDSYSIIDTFRVYENGTYNHFKVGLAPLYNFKKEGKKLSLQVGGDISYQYFKYSINLYEKNLYDNGMKTTIHYGHYLGIGAHIGIQYALTPSINFALQAIPTYLILLQSETNYSDVDSKYSKGMFAAQIQLGFTFKLNK